MSDRQTTEQHNEKNLWPAALLISILAAGALFTWWAVARADREMREDLLQQTRQVAQALDIQSIRSLSGTEADINSPIYLRLKEQLATIRSAIPQIRFVYLMGRKVDGAVFFFVDSEPTDSKGYSPPGQTYEKATESERRVFASRTEAVDGPVVDRRGTWVAALVPILDPKTAMYGLATKEDAQSMVSKAVGFYRKNGREHLLKEMNNPHGEFRKGDLYAFAYDRNMTWLAHPVRPELVGQNWIDKKDWSGGKFFRKEIQQVALSKGSGWVEFEYENPVNGQHDHKTTYVQGIDDMIICSGAYKGDGEILAVLGMDSNASAWNWMLARAALPSILLTLSLAAILLVGSVLLSRRSGIAGAPSHWMRHLELGLVFTVGLVLTLFAAWIVHERETHDRKEAFLQLAAVQTGAIAGTLHNIRDIQLESVARLYSGKEQITPEEFRQFTTYLTNKSAVSTWEWIPAVLAAEKSRFEEAARTAGLKGFEIWQEDGQGKRVPASGRAVYYPVFRVAPLVGNERTLGYDLGSEPIRRAALEETARTGQPTGTDPVTLMQETGTQKGMLIYTPIFDSNGSKRLRGFALAVLQMGTLLKSAGSDKSTLMELYVLHKNAASEPLAATWNADNSPTSGLFAMRPILAFGKTFAATAHAGQEFMQMHPTRAGWLSILIGLALNAALTAVVSLTLRRRQKLLQLVDERTYELRESEALQRLLLDNMPVGVVIVDPVTRVIERVNEHVAALFGAPVDHMLGHRCHAFLCPAREGACPVCDLGQDVDNSDRQMLRADGSLLAILKTVKRIMLNGQEKLLECFVDVSDRKRAENALLETNRHLEEATVEAKIANVAKSEFLANMSHEIRTPMNGVLGMTELLLESKLTDDQRRFAEIVRGSGESLLSLINSILDLSKIEAGKLELDKVEFDLCRVVDESVELLAERAQRKNLDFAYRIQNQVPNALLGDPERLRQILINLLANAIKFTEQGEVVLEVIVKEEDADKCTLQFSIRDTGIGISPAMQAKLFQPFTQVDASTTRKHGGTGLGLAIAKQLSVLMGGDVSFESNPGAGTTFNVTVEFQKQASAVQKKEVAWPEFEHLRILIVDDSATSRRFLTEQMTLWGIHSQRSGDCQEAIEILRASAAAGKRYDIAMIDSKMTGIGSEELARSIKDDPAISSIHLVMMAPVGFCFEEEKRKELNLEASIGKPVQRSRLFNCIVSVMSQSVETPATCVSDNIPNGDMEERFTGCVLIAEDNPINQDVASNMLEALGFSVDVVETGGEAVQAFSKKQYNLIFMDCQMPEMDGYEATRGIRRLEKARCNGNGASGHTPIIALTAHAMQGDRDLCIAAGMDDYLPKPFKKAELLTVICRWTQKRVSAVDSTQEATVFKKDVQSPSDCSTGNYAPVEQPEPVSVVIDCKVLDEIVTVKKSGGNALLGKVIHQYIQNSTKSLKAMSDALERGDANGIGFHAHTMKSSSANVGAQSLACLLQELEPIGMANELDKAGILLQEIEAENRSVIIALERELRKRGLLTP